MPQRAKAVGRKGTMAKEICISSTPHETRLAILEDDQLAEIYYERENEYTLAGSIYNGRVTRVLPGMQSAFVDIGLERDAFLYVTDFLELEDQEETDELEKAAVSGGGQAPREVRHGNGHERGQRPGRPEQRQDRSERDRKPAGEGALESAPADFAAPARAAEEQTEDSQDSSGEPGAKRWRGRRRRRGGRGAGGASETPAESQESTETHLSNAAEPEAEVAGRIQAEAAPVRAPRGGGERAAESFLLPGESLSRYGGSPAESGQKSAPEVQAAARPASTFKPSTLIEAPIRWDGSGLLPGESLSRHRNRETEPEAQTLATENLDSESSSPDALEEQQFVEETTEENLHAGLEPALAQPPDRIASVPVEEDYFEETFEAAPGEHLHEAAGHPEFETATEHEESTEIEGDRSASHHVDPLPPSGFRLFGFGGKKRGTDEEPPTPPSTTQEAKPAAAPVVSAFSPGAGVVEEEVIEGEEIEAPHHHHKMDDHDLDEYEEEEKLHTQIRSGELGEMLQEAHLDHRIQLNFDDKNGDEDGEEALEDEEEEEPVAAEGQPAGDTQSRQRRERGGRGRRGRGGPGGSGGPGGPGNRRGASRRSMQTSDLPIISDLLKPGQEILVQIAKEPIAKKGARITSHIALPGRFLVFMPTVSHVGVSRKIASDEERQRLKRILVHERGDASGGFIVRTAAEGASEDELRADLRFLIHLWNEIKERSDNSKSPALIYHDLSLIERILRDQVSSNFSSIWVDSEADYERIVRFLNRFSPSLVRRVKLYTKEIPLFEHFGIQDEISKALRSKVWLKSGGSIVINQTEALVAIDINTGKYVGKTARLEDTILKTNLDAIPEIVRQIRLRDLGGIIVIDFIDMDERKNRFKVMAALEEALKNDRAPTKVLQFNDFGLVAITRKRVKQSLERTLSVPCPTCQATGMVKSPTTVCNEIFAELRKMKRHLESPDVLLRVNPETVKVLKANNAGWITEFEELIGKNILIKSDASLHPEQFDIQG
jgi:Rne/Rng family ribonuclease